MNISIITFTENGTKLAEKIRQAFVGTKMEEAKKLGLSLSDWTRQQFAEKNAIVVIGACGIAVRMIAPFVSDKLSDSPVVVADEAGMFVIPLLSGHMGGANELAEQIAGQIGGIPVITTATDVNHTFSVDLFAKKCGLSKSLSQNTGWKNAGYCDLIRENRLRAGSTRIAAERIYFRNRLPQGKKL